MENGAAEAYGYAVEGMQLTAGGGTKLQQRISFVYFSTTRGSGRSLRHTP